MLRLCMIAVILAGGLSYGEECRIEKMPTSWDFSSPPGVITENHVQLNGVGRISTTFYLKLSRAVPMDAVAMVIEFIDDQGREIASVPLEGRKDKVRISFQTPFAAQFHQHWTSSSSKSLLSGMFDGALTDSCPTQAKVTFALIQFADGTVQRFSSTGWHLAAMPRIVPILPVTYPDVDVQLPLSLTAKIIIDEAGHVKEIIPNDSSGNPEVWRWISNQMQQLWSFHPGLVDGRPQESVLDVLFRFPADSTLEVPDSALAKPLSHPLSVIQFFHPWDSSRKYIVMYGTLSEDRID